MLSVYIIFKNLSVWQIIVAFLSSLCYSAVLLLIDVLLAAGDGQQFCKGKLRQTFNAAGVIDSKV
jgi:hypothetical protein